MMLGKMVKVPKAVARQALAWLTSPRAALLFGEPFFRLKGMRRRDAGMKLSQVKRVLVLRLDEIGDVVMTTPFLRELRRNLPNAWITLVVKPAVYNLVELCPYVNEVLTYEWRVRGPFTYLRRHVRALELVWRRLWKRRFDLALLPRWDVDYYHGAFLLYFSGAFWRIGYSEEVNEDKRQVNKGQDLLLTHTLKEGGVKHEVERNLDVLRFLEFGVQSTSLELWIGSEDKIFSQTVLESRGVRSDDFLVAFGPGARDPKRRWPIENFLEVGDWLLDQFGARLIVIGGPEDKDLGRLLHNSLGEAVIDVTGQTTLRQTGALLKQCHLFVGNDAGTMHMAAAAGVSVIEISCHPISGSPGHYNSPNRFGPWGVPYVILQPERPLAPCTDGCEASVAHCITQVKVTWVKEAARQLRHGAGDRLSLRRPLEQV